MKNENEINAKNCNQTRNGFGAACAKLARQLEAVKQTVIEEFKAGFEPQNRLLHHMIAEADALAWQTDYPHLLFPVLAAEKAQRAAEWKARQQLLWRSQDVAYALAA